MSMDLDMSQYGKGIIKLAEPNARRAIALQNALFKYCLTGKDKADYKHLRPKAEILRDGGMAEGEVSQEDFFENAISENMGTAMALMVLSYIEEAPFLKPKDNRLDLDAFLDFIGTQDAYNHLFSFVNTNFDLKRGFYGHSPKG